MSPLPAPSAPRHPSRIAGGVALSGVVVFLVAMVVLAIRPPGRTLEWPALLAGLNTVFLGAIPIVLAVGAAASYRTTGALATLLMGGGLMALAYGSLLAGWLMPWVYGPNATVTLHNLGALLAGGFHLAGAHGLGAELHGIPAPRNPRRRDPWVLYGVLGALFVALALLTVGDYLPLFFDPVTGASRLRQCVLGISLGLFAAAGATFLQVWQASRSAFAFWYGLALVLVAIGLGCTMLGRTVGGVLSWTGRGAQYLASVYFVIALLRGRRELGGDGAAKGLRLWPYLEQQIEQATRRLTADNDALRRAITEAAQATETLQANRRLLNHVINGAPFYVFATDRQHRYILANEAYCRLLCRPLGEVIGRAHRDFYPHAQAREFEQVNEAIMAAGIARQIDEPVMGRIVMSSKYPLRDAQGGVVGICGVVTDITERRQLEDARAEALDRLNKIARRLPGVVYQYRLFADGRSCFPYASEALRGIFGVSPEEVRHDATRVLARLHSEDAPAVTASVRTSARELTPWHAEFRVKSLTGDVRWLVCDAVPEREDHGSTLWHGFCADITERKRLELAAAESAQQFRALFDEASDGMLLADPETRTFSLSNRRMQELLGFTAAELGRMAVSDIHPAGELSSVVRAFDELARGRITIAPAVPVRCKDGRVFHADISATRLEAQGRTRLLGVFRDVSGQLRAQREVVEAQARYQRLLEAASDGIHVLDRDGWLIEASASFYSMLGYPPQDPPRRHVADWDVRWQADELKRRIGQVMEHPEVFETRFRRRDGAVIDVEVNAHMILLGGERCLYASARDITDRKRLIGDLQVSRDELARAMDQARIAHWEMDPATGIYTFNDRFYALYGTTAEREGGYRMPAEVYAREFLPPELHAWFAAVAARRRHGECEDGQREHVILRRDGAVRHVSVLISAVRDARGQLLAVRGSNQDITERRQAECQLRESEARFRSVVTAMSEGAVLQRADGVIVECNRQAEILLGLTHDQMLGRTSMNPEWHAIKYDGSPFPGDEHPAMVALRSGQPACNIVMGVHRPNGILRWININAEPVILPGETRPQAVVATFSDITDRLAHQEKLKNLLNQAEDEANAKSRLLREVNHRVMNNLSAVLGLLTFEREALAGPDCPRVEATLGRLQQRIAGLLTLHRLLSQTAWAPVGLTPLAEQVIGEALEVMPGRIRPTVTIEPCELRVSPRQAGSLAMVLSELATNAVKHAQPERSPVMISVALRREGEWTTLRFRDNGGGYPPGVVANHLPNVGLRLVRELVATTLRGSLTLANEGGACATIRMHLEAETRT